MLRLLISVAALATAAAVLAGCSTQPSAVTSTPSPQTREVLAKTPVPESPTFEEIALDAGAIADLDELGLCDLYGPTVDGQHGPLVQQISELYVSGNVTQEGVETLMTRLDAAEAVAVSPAMAAAVRSMNQPIINMQTAISESSTSFSNSWDAPASASALMQACLDAGFRR